MNREAMEERSDATEPAFEFSQNPLEFVRQTGEKFSKGEAEYKKGEPFSRCGLCEYYGQHACKVTRGYIVPMQMCKFFARADKD